jgi:hypothetical protein
MGRMGKTAAHGRLWQPPKSPTPPPSPLLPADRRLQPPAKPRGRGWLARRCACVGITTGGIPSSSLARVQARGGRGRALHDGEATRTLGRVSEPTG